MKIGENIYYCCSFYLWNNKTNVAQFIQKIIRNTTDFNTDNNKKYFLMLSNSAYWNDFWGIVWRLE